MSYGNQFRAEMPQQDCRSRENRPACRLSAVGMLEKKRPARGVSSRVAVGLLDVVVGQHYGLRCQVGVPGVAKGGGGDE